MLAIIIFFFITVNSIENEFETLALTKGFQIIPKSQVTCSFNDLSCYNVLCNMLNNSALCASAIIVAPISKTFDCSKLPKHNRNANMVMFGVDMALDVSNATTCFSVYDCLLKGCELYRDSNKNFGATYVG